MSEEHTTAVVQRYLDELAEDSPAEPIVRALLDRAVRRLHLLCATLLYRSYPRLTQPPLNLQADELHGAVAERLLKMLIAGAYAGPHERARFQREAEAVASLRHANIVQIYDVGEHEGRPYFTMEFVEGGSLARTLAGTPQPARQAAAMLAELAQAVHVAHQGGIVHRDLKPANILLTTEGTPKIADFGLARHLDGESALTVSGIGMGTPSYMAPEQASGTVGTIGPAADIYSLGALLYELLTGRPPFRGETASETERQVIAAEPVPPMRLNPKVPRDLETICLRSRAALGDNQPVGRVEELATECRYPAARCAALAGCELGEDGARLDEAERMRWRRQARDGLRAGLAVWAETRDGGSRAARDLIRKMLAHWEVDPGLARLRETSLMDNLFADERKECLELWQAVGNLISRARGSV